ncbi:hypothetical protein CHS0354_027935 [Potamilus streckersoni]|uniref:Kyphoscoliosis peptidase n=1 Tax=Potamilus streckersoni TaxID=2493646 RepID=A0AAE0TC59_9BIVA|nr:hypothetical protein CHS0354_027935 [Potamilus streckersoni]
MGAKVSKAVGVKVEEESGSDYLKEDIVEEKVPFYLPGYPEAHPPPNKKEDIFNIEDYKDVDERAKTIPDSVADSFDKLIEHLTRDLKDDLQKLRAIFIWLGHQNIEGGKYKDQATDTPIGCMKAIKEKKGTYATFFAVLCRAAKMPCTIIKGFAKSVSYEVGMTEQECKDLNNTWNAVYVKNGWRMIHPLWAYRAITGHSHGYFTKVEDKGKAVREKERASSGKLVTHFNEYYFLTNPEELIYNCYPNEEKWQLLETPWTFKQFVEVPFCRQAFLENKVKFKGSHKGIIYTIGGECTVTIHSMKDMVFNYKLYYNEKESDTPITQTLQLDRYVFISHDQQVIRFQARFPQKGVYRFQVVGGNTLEFSLDLCSFKIVCVQAKDNCQPLPITPEIGFGPSEVLKKAGIKAKSHRTGVVKIEVYRELQISFETQKIVSVETKLVHNTIEETDLIRCISQKVTKKTITINVRVIQRGEYVLQMFTMGEGRMEDKKNVCNYLLTSDTEPKTIRQYENAEEKKARSNMTGLATARKDLESLDTAIEKFQKLGLDDKGDLSLAIDALDIGRMEKDLKDAIGRRRLDCLQKSITRASESKFRDKLHSLLSKAEEARDDLNKLRGFAHDILELKHSTIAELRGYKTPPKVIHDVMIATFLLLGEKTEDLQYWETIRNLLSQPQDILRKVKQFNPMNVSSVTYDDVATILQAHTLDSARKASAGAGTFYDWAKKISEEMGNRFASTG